MDVDVMMSGSHRRAPSIDNDRGQLMKPGLMRFVSVLLIGALVAILFAFLDPIHRGKWLSSAGLMFDIAGIAQLDIVGFMDQIFEKYGDETKYPGGPPSHITRRIIENPETPIWNWIKQNLFYEHRSGFYMIVIGFVFQLVGTWA
jgi:hypothetical protein